MMRGSFFLCVIFDYKIEVFLPKTLAPVTDDRRMLGIGRVKSDAEARGLASTPYMRVLQKEQ